MDVDLEVNTTLTVQECGSEEELQTLREAWNELWLQCPRATPFQSAEWLITWWKHLGEGELWILALRQGDRLVGLAPLLIDCHPETSERTVLFLGTGITDYLDVLLLPGFEREGAAAILNHLEANCERWDRCDFQQLPGSSPLLEAGGGLEWTSEIAVQEVCPVLRLPSTTQELPAQVPTRMLDRLKYYRRRLARTAPVQVESVQAENFEELFDQFVHLHQSRWGTHGQKGALETEDLQAFHREAAWHLLATGTLRLYTLKLGEQFAATLYGFSHGGRTFYYLGGFDPQIAEYSPGTVMIGHAIEQAIEEGAGEFDFLRGREAYKYLWGAKGRLNYRRQLWHAEAA